MDKNAVEAARMSLAKAEAGLQAMQNAKQYSEFQIAWSDFLIACHRVYSKLEQGSKDDGQGSAWLGRKRHERKNDPLLAYLQHARNADEHGIKPITQHNPGGMTIQSTGSTHLKQFGLWPDGTIKLASEGSPLKVTIVPNSADLIPVTDRGVTYEPPKQHKEASIKDHSPGSIAKLAVSHLRSMIAEAEHLS